MSLATEVEPGKAADEKIFHRFGFKVDDGKNVKQLLIVERIANSER